MVIHGKIFQSLMNAQQLILTIKHFTIVLFLTHFLSIWFLLTCHDGHVITGSSKYIIYKNPDSDCKLSRFLFCIMCVLLEIYMINWCLWWLLNKSWSYLFQSKNAVDFSSCSCIIVDPSYKVIKVPFQCSLWEW